MTRVAAVFSHPIQYFAPLFRLLAAEESFEFKVFFRDAGGAAGYRDAGFGREVTWDIPLLEGYRWELHSPWGTRGKLNAFDADVVWVHGYSSLTSLRALWWGRKRRVILTGDSELLHKRGLAKRLAKRLLLPPLFRRVDVFLDYGERNREYYRHYGVPDAKMVHGGYPLDIARFQGARDAMTDEERAGLKTGLGLQPGAFTVVWAGKFIPAKRPLDLIRAIALLKGRGLKVQALFIGAGSLQEEMERVSAAKGLGEEVRFAGFVNQAEMPRVLSLGDALVMSSEKEPYGLMIPEAMAVGNAIVASDRVGCVSATGVARPGVNTVVYPCGDVPALAETIERLASSPERLAAMQRSSRELAWQQDCSAVARAVRDAVRLARGGRPG